MRKVGSSWELFHRLSDNWGYGIVAPSSWGGPSDSFLPAHVIAVGSPVTWWACSRLAANVKRERSSRAQHRQLAASNIFVEDKK